MPLFPFFPFGFMVLAVVVTVGIAILQRRAQGVAWAGAASQLGMSLESGAILQPTTLQGQLESFPVIVDVVREGSGKNSRVYTRYRVSYPSLGLGLRLGRETGVTRLIRFFGVEDHAIGDEIFDRAFEIKADNESAVGTFLTPSRREMLLRLQAAYPGVVIEDSQIQLKTSGIEKNSDVLVSTVRRLVGTARPLTGSRPMSDIDEAVARRLAGDLADSVPEVVVRPHPDDIDGALLEVEGLYGAGRLEEAAEVVDRLREDLPADPEVVGWQQQVEEPSPAVPADRAPSEDPVPIAKELFAEHRLSFETTALFEERFAGTNVRWSGVVRRSTQRTHDRDFDSGPITKAIVHVATIENDLYGNAEVDAIVAFPPDTTLERGDEITFTGTLVKADGLVRNLFVAEATVLA